jgi:hypothetical protein
VTIIRTPSTTNYGITLSFDHECNALVQASHDYSGTIDKSKKVKLDTKLCQQFLSALDQVASLKELSSFMCAKSVSSGTSLFIERNGEKSGDISCPADDHTRALNDSAAFIIQNADNLSGFSSEN